jgi:hypothetical protein
MVVTAAVQTYTSAAIQGTSRHIYLFLFHETDLMDDNVSQDDGDVAWDQI